MTSSPIKSIAADSNALLSALVGKAGRRVFEFEPPIDVITTEGTIAEVEEYLPEFAEKYGLDQAVLKAALAVLPVRRFSESGYVSHLPQARKYLAKRDPDDVGLAALALSWVYRFGQTTTTSRNCQTLKFTQQPSCWLHLGFFQIGPVQSLSAQIRVHPPPC